MNLGADVISPEALLAFVALALVVGAMGGMLLGRWCDRNDREANHGAHGTVQ
jgi:hypothetical protein